MLNSEILNIFDNSRPEFKPYGFTVEMWTPKLMPRPDRHNEIEKMTIFIARNYMRPIKNGDIEKAVGLHPDYANTVFKKSFGMTLNQYLLQQKILHVQRQLSVSNDRITDPYKYSHHFPRRSNTCARCCTSNIQVSKPSLF